MFEEIETPEMIDRESVFLYLNTNTNSIAMEIEYDVNSLFYIYSWFICDMWHET